MEKACPGITNRYDRQIPPFSVYVSAFDPRENDDRQVVDTVHMRIRQAANSSTEVIIELLIESDEIFASLL